MTIYDHYTALPERKTPISHCRMLQEKVADLEVQIAESLLSSSYHASQYFGGEVQPRDHLRSSSWFGIPCVFCDSNFYQCFVPVSNGPPWSTRCPGSGMVNCAPGSKISPAAWGSRRNWCSNWLTWTQNTKIWRAAMPWPMPPEAAWPGNAAYWRRKMHGWKRACWGTQGVPGSLSLNNRPVHPQSNSCYLMSLFEALNHPQFQRAMVFITPHTIPMSHGE